MADLIVLVTETVVVEEQLSFTLSALCRASGAGPAQVRALVDEGLLQPTGQGPQDWHFGGEALPQTRRALRLARDFQLDLAAVSLVMDLLAEIECLRARLHRSAQPTSYGVEQTRPGSDRYKPADPASAINELLAPHQEDTP